MAYMDDVSETSNNNTHDQVKDTLRLRYQCSVELNQWAGLQMNMAAIKSFLLQQGVLCSGISVDNPASKTPGPI